MCKKSYANDQSKLENFDDVGLNSLDTGSNVGTEVWEIVIFGTNKCNVKQRPYS